MVNSRQNVQFSVPATSLLCLAASLHWAGRMLYSNQLVLTCALGEALYEITLFRFEGLVFKTEPSKINIENHSICLDNFIFVKQSSMLLINASVNKRYICFVFSYSRAAQPYSLWRRKMKSWNNWLYSENSHVLLAKRAFFPVLVLLLKSCVVCSLHFKSSENSLKLR